MRRLDWRISQNGNPYLRMNGKCAVVFPNNLRDDRWRVMIADGDDKEFLPDYYYSAEDAKHAAFDFLNR